MTGGAIQSAAILLARERARSSARARVRGRARLPGGRGRARASRPAVLRRQGLDRPAAAGREGLPPRPLPLPRAARRHGPQLPRGARVPRPPRRGDRRAADRRQGRGLDRGRAGARGVGPVQARHVAQPAPDRDAARRDRARALRRRVRRRPARRGARAGEGADLLLPRRLRPVGPARPAPGALEPLQRPHPARRARARLPALELDRARRLALHPAGAARAAVDLLRARPRGVRARRDALRRLGVRRAVLGDRSPSPCATAPSAT